MYYRRKILLTLLDQFRGKLDKISLQKYLFLLARQQEKKSYHFVPYKYGCYSFQANADLKTLSKYNQIVETEKFWEKTDDKNHYEALTTKDKAALRYVKSQFGQLNAEQLIKLTYRQFPFYAINSEIAKKHLTLDELIKIEKERICKNDTVLFTIGYEGISLEEYINKLIVNDVKVLCDVRKNPLSMKFGFNKNQLQNACKGVNIEYLHFPEVGIESSNRQQLNTQSDYEKLFEFYRSVVLKKEKKRQIELLSLLRSKKRIALTCFEANISNCHRKHLAESIAQLGGVRFDIRHI